MNIKKALLINPPSGLYIREDRCQLPVKGLSPTVVRPPMDLAYIASGLKEAGIECKIKDYPAERENWQRFRRDIEKFRPDMLVISVTTPTLKVDMKACDIAKRINPQILVAAKGAHFIVNSAKILEEFSELDIVVRREPERVIPEIAAEKNLKNILGITYRDNDKIITNPDRPYTQDLNVIPFPDRDLLRNELYIRPDTGEMQATIQTSAGCPVGCIFCLAQPVSGNKIRSRDPKNIVDEIEECVNKYKIRNFFFRADTFTWNKNWVIRICEEILKRKLNIEWVANSRADTLDEELLLYMKRSGCWLVSLGIESGNQDILDKINKGITLEQCRKAVRLCKSSKIKTFLFFIIGFPWDDDKTIEQTINFAKELNGDYYEVHTAVPFPGTELYEIAKENNLLMDSDIIRHDHFKAGMNTFSLSYKEINKFRKHFLLKIYLRPEYIIKTLLQSKSAKAAFKHFCYGVKRLPDLLFH
ncbi:MAG: radical SAM protein [Elusimicrobia bacterium]|nr:radical SAM protein [Elusimicrobiota bacterium]